jgi:hypothetical protein
MGKLFMNRTPRHIVFLVFLGFVFLTCGCRRTLFPKNDQRSQFEAYNTMRYGPQITEQKDAFGLPEPALRARLGKKE